MQSHPPDRGSTLGRLTAAGTSTAPQPLQAASPPCGRRGRRGCRGRWMQRRRGAQPLRQLAREQHAVCKRRWPQLHSMLESRDAAAAAHVHAALLHVCAPSVPQVAKHVSPCCVLHHNGQGLRHKSERGTASVHTSEVHAEAETAAWSGSRPQPLAQSVEPHA